ncbi:MAG: hypothetical protein CMM73_01490 [Rhodospirillaceae bacterium]|nr:hypothetical protein [Rhodospirillaceae bacterium]|tara:strand:- start:2065 stop:2553 length:489 start_codon:yes stop_codon:yes gene_type:complete
MWLSRLIIVPLIIVLAACTGLSVRPLGNGFTNDNLGVAVIETGGRNGQIYSRALNSFLEGAANPAFTLSSELSVASSSTLTVRGSSSNLKKRSMTVKIILVDTVTGETVMSDSITESSTVGTVSSYYGQTRSDTHSDERTSLLLAERVAARVHLYFLDAKGQ